MVSHPEDMKDNQNECTQVFGLKILVEEVACWSTRWSQDLLLLVCSIVFLISVVVTLFSNCGTGTPRDTKVA
jgi:hypothetical protein